LRRQNAKGGEMKAIVLLLTCLANLSLSVQAGELYRWVDKAGKVSYGDVPPTEVKDVERIKFTGESARYEDMPYETRRAQQNFPVTLYVADGCGELCDQARSLLNNRGIPFSEKLLKTQDDFAAFKQMSGIENVVPALAVGKTYLKGLVVPQWNSELDAAGYPKTASYRQRIAPPAPAATPPAEGSAGQ
jgi:hypothetical protein